LILALAPVHWATAQETNPAACRMSADSTRRVELPDGRTVSVDVQSLARRGDTVMAIGRHAYVFPRSATPRMGPVMQDSIIGFMLTPDGKTSLVPAPLRGRKVFFPKVAAAADGFHFVFATGGDSMEVDVGMQDSATIWHARYDGTRWTTPERVTSVGRSNLSHEYSSALLEHGGTLSFAFSFGEGNEKRGGVILLRRQGGAWRTDTLHTPGTPISVRILAKPRDGSLVALFHLPFPVPGASYSQLQLAAFKSTWQEPRMVAESKGFMLPSLAALGDGYVVSWNSWEAPDAGTLTLQWIRIEADGRILARPVITSGEQGFPHEMLVRKERYPIWIYRGVPYGSLLSASYATDSAVIVLGQVAVPFENPRALTIPLDSTRVLAFTMKQGKAPDEPMVASYVTILEFRCLMSERRM
jgi:hypothetical protein